MAAEKIEPYQQSLPLHLADKGDFSTFVEGANLNLVTVLKKAVATCKNEFFYIFGPSGCGKSHLLNSLYHCVDNSAARCFYIDAGQARKISPELFNVPLPEFVFIDNIDALAGDESFELAAFALFNRWYDKRSGLLIMSGKSSADAIPFLRRDLNTRIGSGIMMSMSYLDEFACARALQKRAKARAFSLPSATASFLVRHCNRDMKSLIEILNRLDKAQLELSHELTIPFVKKILKI